MTKERVSLALSPEVLREIEEGMYIQVCLCGASAAQGPRGVRRGHHEEARGAPHPVKAGRSLSVRELMSVSAYSRLLGIKRFRI
jgi:hypothetical protein